MKRILLSFNPQYYDPIVKGEKKYEYRTRFCNEAVEAYLYLSSPIRKIVAITYLGERILLEDMLVKYHSDSETLRRINEYIKLYKKRYAIPIEKVEFIEPISLDEIREKIPGFMPPRSFQIIKKDSALEKLLSNSKLNGDVIVLDHNSIKPEEICIN